MKPFSKDNPPPGNGRPKGSKNRSTILKKWLDVTVKVKNPETNKTEIGTLEDQIVLSLINAAKKGNVRAVQEILDTRYGKLNEKIEVEHSQRVRELEARIKSLVSDAVLAEVGNRVKSLPVEYQERFQDFGDISSISQTFVHDLVEMDEEQLKQLFFTQDDVNLIRSLLG